MIFHRWSGNFVIATPADSGLYQVLAIPELSELPRFRRASRKLPGVRPPLRPVAQALSGARRVGKLFGILRWEGFFREATGPGWVLASDAGHFKDPLQARAFRTRSGRLGSCAGDPRRDQQVAVRAGRGARGLGALARWRRGEHYWLAADLGKAGWRLQCTGDRTAFVRAGQAGLVHGPVQPSLRSSRGCRPLGYWPRQPACSRVADATGERCWARWWPHRPGRPAETPGPASALCPARSVGGRRAG